MSTYDNQNEYATGGRLIHYVKKTHNLQCGIFGNISDDLGEAINRDDLSPMVKMAYAYARRSVAAGLLYQGVFSLDQFRHVNDVFIAFQINTGHTAEFQEAAFDQAAELTSSYDPRLDRNILSLLVVGALDLTKNNTEPKYLPGAPFSYEYVVDYVVKFSKSHSNNQTNNTTTETISKSPSNSTGCGVVMNRLTYNLIFWPCFIFGAYFAHATENSPNATNSYVLLALCIVCFVVSGIRIKTLGRSLWNLLWLCIPVACCIYALFIGISNKRV